MLRFKMGWLQVRKWLSFLPAAFVVYILLHYLIYQPNLRESRPTFTGESRSLNSSSAVPLSLIDTHTDQDASQWPHSGISPPANDVYKRNLSPLVASEEGELDDVSPIRRLSADLMQNTDTANPNPDYNVGAEPLNQQPQPAPNVALTASTDEQMSKSSEHTFVSNDSAGSNAAHSIPDLANNGPDYLLDQSVPLTNGRGLLDSSGSKNIDASVAEPSAKVETIKNSDVDAKQTNYESVPVVLAANELPVAQPLNSFSLTQNVLKPVKAEAGLPNGYPGGKLVMANGSAERNSQNKVMTSVKSADTSVPQMTGLAQASRTLSSSGADDLSHGVAAITSQVDNVVKDKPKEMPALKPENKLKQTTLKGKGTVKKPAQSKPAAPKGLTIDYLKGPVTVGDKYEKGFRNAQQGVCPNKGRDLRVLIIVTTAPDHEHHRNAIRQTWGHFSMRRDVSIVFLVGSTARTDIQNLIDRENDRYSDIIEANFVDHYGNLTLKTASMFEWLGSYCEQAHFVLKTDDDMYINVPLLLAFINTKKNEKKAIFGRLAKGWKPVRNKKSKYYIGSSIYSRARYPDFLTGPAYLFTNDIVNEIYAKALNTTFFMLEDVFITGFVGESLKIKRVGDSHFRNEKISLKDTCKLMYSISIHMVKYEEQFDIYKRTLDGKTKCKTP